MVQIAVEGLLLRFPPEVTSLWRLTNQFITVLFFVPSVVKISRAKNIKLDWPEIQFFIGEKLKQSSRVLYRIC